MATAMAPLARATFTRRRSTSPAASSRRRCFHSLRGTGSMAHASALMARKASGERGDRPAAMFSSHMLNTRIARPTVYSTRSRAPRWAPS
jgi:hypothetical protein